MERAPEIRMACSQLCMSSGSLASITYSKLFAACTDEQNGSLRQCAKKEIEFNGTNFKDESVLSVWHLQRSCFSSLSDEEAENAAFGLTRLGWRKELEHVATDGFDEAETTSFPFRCPIQALTGEVIDDSLKQRFHHQLRHAALAAPQEDTAGLPLRNTCELSVRMVVVTSAR